MRQGRLCNSSHKPDLRWGVRCGIPVRERCGGRGRHGSTRWFLIIPEVASGGFDGGDGIFTRNPPSKAASGVEWSVNYWTGRRISTQSAWAPSERHLHSTSGALSCGLHVRLRIHYVARHSVERLQDLVVVDVDARTKGTGPN